MNDPIKKAHDIDSIRKDIDERTEMINTYLTASRLDRDKAISKIMELRKTDENVAAVTAVKLAQYSVPFSEVPNENIVAELKRQVDILTAELVKKTTELIQIRLHHAEHLQSVHNMHLCIPLQPLSHLTEI